jgi:hypothetical protein
LSAAMPARHESSHQLDTVELHALGDESREAPGLILREMQVVRGDRVLAAGEADREPAGAGREVRVALDKGREGV